MDEHPTPQNPQDQPQPKPKAPKPKPAQPAALDPGDKAWKAHSRENCINRFHQIFMEGRLSQRLYKRFPTAKDLALEIERDERTVYRLIKTMRIDLRLPIDIIEEYGGYGYTEDVMGLPTLVYTKGESIGLCFSMMATSMYEHTPFARDSESIIKKMTSGFRRDMAIGFDALRKHVSFHCTGMDAFIPPVNFEVVTPAVIDCQELEIDYVKPTDPSSRDDLRDAEPGLRRVEPIHLACVDFGWYLFAWDPARNDLRTFALRRIRQIRATGRKLERRPIDVKAELDASFGPYINQKKETVRLRFWGHAARVIPEFIWNRHQQISKVPDDPAAIEVTLHVAVNPRLIGWIGEWLGEVGVIEPKILRDTIRTRVLKAAADQDRMAALYN